MYVALDLQHRKWSCISLGLKIVEIPSLRTITDNFIHMQYADTFICIEFISLQKFNTIVRNTGTSMGASIKAVGQFIIYRCTIIKVDTMFYKSIGILLAGTCKREVDSSFLWT